MIRPPRSMSDQEFAARALCRRLLSRGPKTRAQLLNALERAGISTEIAESVLDEFADSGIIDDQLFAQAWVSSRHYGRGLARKALTTELRQRGVDKSTIDSVLTYLNPATEETMARQLVLRRLRVLHHLEPHVQVRRLSMMLARKGYPATLSLRVVRDVVYGNNGSGPECGG